MDEKVKEVPAAPESQKSEPTLWALSMEAAAGLRSMLATDGLFSDADWRGKVKCLLSGLVFARPVPPKEMTEAIVQDADKARAAITGMLGAEATEVALAAHGRLVLTAAQVPGLLEMLAEARRARDVALSSEIAHHERVAALDADLTRSEAAHEDLLRRLAHPFGEAEAPPVFVSKTEDGKGYVGQVMLEGFDIITTASTRGEATSLALALTAKEAVRQLEETKAKVAALEDSIGSGRRHVERMWMDLQEAGCPRPLPLENGTSFDPCDGIRWLRTRAEQAESELVRVNDWFCAVAEVVSGRRTDGAMVATTLDAVKALKAECDAAEALVEEWKMASGLERGGDPDAVRPADLAADLVKREKEAQSLRDRVAALQENVTLAHAQAQADTDAIVTHLGRKAMRVLGLPPPRKVVCDIIGRMHEVEAERDAHWKALEEARHNLQVRTKQWEDVFHAKADEVAADKIRSLTAHADMARQERDAYRKGLVAVGEFASQGGSGVPPSTPEYEEAQSAVARLWNGRDDLRKRVDALETAAAQANTRAGDVALEVLAERDAARTRVADLERELGEETARHQRWEERAMGEYEEALTEEKGYVTRLKHALKQTARVWDATGGHCWCVHREAGETVKEHDARCAELRAVLGEGTQAVAPASPARLSEEVTRPWIHLLTDTTKHRPSRHWVDFALAALPEAMREVCSGRVVTAPGEEVQATVARVAGDVADAMVARLEAAARREAEADKAQAAAFHESILPPTKP